AKENIAWRTPLKGLGTSTPIVYGDRIFLTSQLGDGPFEQRGRDFEDAAVAKKTGESGPVQFAVQAFSRQDGRPLWEHKFAAEGHVHPVHLKHNLASPSCVTDGEIVIAWFGTGQLVALTLEGKPLWKRHLGQEIAPFDILWGHGSSPMIHNGKVMLLVDHAPAAYLLAVDSRTGREVWKVNRGKQRRSYSTPFVVRANGRDQLVVNSDERMDVYDPANGELLWFVGEHIRVPIAMPVFHNGVIYSSRGYQSGPYFAVKPGGSGDVGKSHLAWEVKAGAPYVSSLLYYRGLLYMANERGVVSCVDAADGKTLWRERFGGVFSASPVGAGGRVYLVNEQGETFVLAAGRDLKILERNKLDERILASPAISGGRIYMRSDNHLLAIGK
ncbi:MAG: PQQ-binding-like beta-propeller repeat protein, partial [Bryobacteraceae bacterium]|nr:PQQ-binding-like beta-propeller repeat protein [Bryobacteraceae bacterium]